MPNEFASAYPAATRQGVALARGQSGFKRKREAVETIMSMREQAARGVAWTSIETMGGQAITLAVFIVLARLLEPSAFGLVAISSAFIALMGPFLSMGFNAAIVQREDLQRGHLDTAFWIYIGAGTVLFGIGFASAGLLAELYRLPELEAVIRWLSALFLIEAAANVQVAILRRKLAFKSLAVRTLVARVAGGVAGVVMAVQGFGVWSLVGQQLVNGVSQLIVLWFVSDWRPGFRVTVAYFKDLFGFSMSIMGSQMLTVLSRRSDDFLIGYFLGPMALGYYSVGYRLVRLVTNLLAGTVQKVAFPVFSRMQDDKDRLCRAFYSATRLTMLIALPGFLALIGLAPELIPTLFGEKWVDSVPVMQVLALMGVLRAIVGFNVAILISQGKPSWRLVIQSIETVVMVGGFMIAVSWGIVAVALARLIAGIALTPVWFRASQRLSGIRVRLFLQNCLVPLGGSSIMLAAIYMAKTLVGDALGGFAELSVYCLAAAIAYIVAVRLLSPGLASEAMELFRSLRKTNGDRKRKKRQSAVPEDAA